MCVFFFLFLSVCHSLSFPPSCPDTHACFVSGRVLGPVTRLLGREDESLQGMVLVHGRTGLGTLARKLGKAVVGYIPYGTLMVQVGPEQARIILEMEREGNVHWWMQMIHHLDFKAGGNILLDRLKSVAFFNASIFLVPHLGNMDTDGLRKKIEFYLENSNLDFELQLVSNNRFDLIMGKDGAAEFAILNTLRWIAEQKEVISLQKQPRRKLLNRWSRMIMQNANGFPNSTAPFDESLVLSNIFNLTGAGEVVGIVDSGIDLTSCFFYDPDYVAKHSGRLAPFFSMNRNLNAPAKTPTSDDMTHRKVIQYIALGDESDESRLGHGTHTSGAVAGKSLIPLSGSIQHSLFNGMAFDAKISFLDIADANLKLYIPVNLKENAFQWAYNAGARVHSNSWGSDSTDPSYAEDAIQVDSFMCSHPDFLIIFAAGNDGANGYHTVSSPSTAKNALVVGATQAANAGFVESACGPLPPLSPYMDVVSYSCATFKGQREHYDLPNIAYFSSMGPTKDHRNKPDVVAPGEFIVSARSDGVPHVNCDSETKNIIKKLAGTSMAAPIQAGHVLLLRQYLREGFYPHGSRGSGKPLFPSAALLKALVIHGTRAVNGNQDKGCCVGANKFSTPESGKCCCIGLACITKKNSAAAYQYRPLISGSPNFQQGYGIMNLARSAYFSLNDSSAFSVPVFFLGHSRRIFLNNWNLAIDPLLIVVSPFEIQTHLQYTTSLLGDPIFDNTKGEAVVHEYAFCTTHFDHFTANASLPDPFVRATLVWTDYPGSENAAHALVSDLDLVLMKESDRDNKTLFRFGVIFFCFLYN